VILDPALLDRLRRPPRTRMRTSEALGAVLAGSAEIDDETVPVVAKGPLADLAAQVARIASAPVPVGPPPGLKTELRPYQQRGLAWLAGTCAGIRTHDRTRNGNPAPAPSRSGPGRGGSLTRFRRSGPGWPRHTSSDRSFYGAHGEPVLPTMSIRLH
jgi:hypothetical protein